MFALFLYRTSSLLSIIFHKKRTLKIFIFSQLSVNPRPAYLPPAIPDDLSDRIQRLHDDPIVWWIGQFIKYMLRPQSHLKAALLFASKYSTNNLDKHIFILPSYCFW